MEAVRTSLPRPVTQNQPQTTQHHKTTHSILHLFPEAGLRVQLGSKLWQESFLFPTGTLEMGFNPGCLISESC